MINEAKEIEQKIRTTSVEISNIFPKTAMACSRQSLWTEALNKGLITPDLYAEAREYYGNLWNYCGD